MRPATDAGSGEEPVRNGVHRNVSTVSQGATTEPAVIVVHGAWTGGRLHLWGESGDAFGSPGGGEGAHPFACDAVTLRGAIGVGGGEAGEIELRLPVIGSSPAPSHELALALGRSAEGEAPEGCQMACE